MKFGENAKSTIAKAVVGLHDDAVLTALSVLTKVTENDILYGHYVDAILEERPLPDGATADDLREMLIHQTQILGLLYHDEIAAAKKEFVAEFEKEGEICESSESESGLTSQMRVF